MTLENNHNSNPETLVAPSTLELRCSWFVQFYLFFTPLFNLYDLQLKEKMNDDVLLPVVLLVLLLLFEAVNNHQQVHS